MSFIGSSSFAPTVSPVNFLPQFEKLGAKLAAPTWLTDLSLKIMYPRLFDNDAHRAVLSGLPESHYSVLYSSDHSAGTGYIGRVDFDDIEGTWTDSGNYIHSGVHQRETPHPMYDPVNQRVNVYCHDNTSTGTNAGQATRLLTTTDLVTLTDQGEVMTYGHHTGYAQVWYDSGFKAAHLMVGGEYFCWGYSTSVDGSSWALSRMYFSQQNHVVGTAKVFSGDFFLFQIGSKWYCLSNLRPRPANTGTIGSADRLVAFEIDFDSLRPIGTGYYKLVEPGTGADTDVRLNNHNSIYAVGDFYYILYDARDSDGNSAIHVAKSTLIPANNVATKTNFVYPVLSDGELYRAATPTTELDWDATAGDLPATVIKAAIAGSDTSTYQAGVGYRLSGTDTPDLWLYGNATYDPNDFETLEFIIADLHYTGTGNGELRLGWNNGTTTIDNDAAYFRWSTTTGNGEGGIFELLKADAGVSADSWTLGYFEGDANVRPWTRTHPFKLSVRLSNFGMRASLLVDDQVTFSANLVDSAMVWTNEVRPFVEYKSGDSLYFTRWTVKSYA